MKKFMKAHLCYLPVILSLFLFVNAEAQEKKKIYDIPLKYSSFWILNDRNCPIQLGKPRVFADPDGWLHYSYTITNVSNKPITKFEIREFDAFENPSYSSRPNINPSKRVRPALLRFIV